MVVLTDYQRSVVQKYALSALCEFDRICKSHHINYTLAYGTLIGAIRHKGFIPWDDDVDVCVSRSDLQRLRSFANKELGNGFFYQSQSSDNNWYRLYDKIRVDNTVFREIAHEKEHIHQGVYIDVFPVDFLPDKKIPALFQLLSYKITSSILSAKYINLRSRHGINKAIAILLRVIFFLIKKKWLYVISEKIASYTTNGKSIRSFESAYREVIPRLLFEEFVDVDFENSKFSSIAKYDYWLKSVYGDYMSLPSEDKRISVHALSDLKI